MPGDLIVEGALLSSSPNDGAYDGSDVLSLLVQAHRRWNAAPPGSASCAGAACTMLLTLEVEEDEGTGSTPKLVVPKRRLHSAAGGNDDRRPYTDGANGLLAMSSTAAVDRSPTVSLRTDLHDVHLYAVSNWVFKLIHARPNMQSFQSEVLPLLISRQDRGVEGAFGPSAWKKSEGSRERLRRVLKELDGGGAEEGGGISCDKVSALLGMYASGKMSGGLGSFVPNDNDANPAADEMDPTTPKADPGISASSSLLCPPFPATKHAYAISAQVLSREASTLTLRACTLPSLLYGCGAITSQTLKLDPAVSSSLVAKGATLSTKFNSILMTSCTVGEKVQTKGCTIVGSNVTLGDRSKLNNVVVMDGVAVGNNTVLQNSLVGANARIGDNCNLRDCQVGPGAEVPSGTKTVEKGEAFHV